MPPQNKPINIDQNGMIQDSHCRVRVHKNAGDTIEFNSLGQGGPWRIEFKEPGLFKEPAPYEVPQGPHGKLVLTPVAPPDPKVKHAYQVKDASGIITDDPDVIIEI